jgi:hypothetical protein
LLKPEGRDVNIEKILTLGGYYWPPSLKGNLPILGVARIVVRFFFASIFLAYVEPKLFFRTRGGKIL